MRWLPEYKFVSVEDVRASPEARDDIEAAILGRGSPPLPSEVLDKLPALRVVGIMALSLARYGPGALLSRGVTLLNSTQSYARSVGEFALGLAILGRRRAFVSHELMLKGGWGVEHPASGVRGMARRVALWLRPVARAIGLEVTLLRLWRSAGSVLGSQATRVSGARDLRGATVGLIGWGANARDFAQRLIGAEARVLVYSEHASSEQISASGAIPASLVEVLAADVVSLHRGLTPQTRHSLGAAELAKLRAGSVLINVARGALIEPGALRDRLRKGDIFACLDTFDEEPLSPSDPLRRAKNVFLTSHIAGGSPDMHAAAAEEVVRKVADYLGGRRPESIAVERLRTMT
jgi:phosphoglycerate dehydrogenase-like enzyme